MPCQRRALPEPTRPSRAGPDSTALNQYPWDLARRACQALGALNGALASGVRVFDEPADLDAVLVELALLVGDLPQVLDRAAEWLAEQHAAGAVPGSPMPVHTERAVAEAVRDLQLGKLYAKRKASPVEAMKAVLARSEKINPILNAFCTVDTEEALRAARASERRWKKGKPLSPIDGMPVSIKDVIETADMPTGQGSLLFEGHETRRDSASVHALREAGAIIIGKTTTTAKLAARCVMRFGAFSVSLNRSGVALFQPARIFSLGAR